MDQSHYGAVSYALRHVYVEGYNSSAIETNPLGMRLVLVDFWDLGSEEEGEGDHLKDIAEGPYYV